jgi:hypothetical protein
MKASPCAARTFFTHARSSASDTRYRFPPNRAGEIESRIGFPDRLPRTSRVTLRGVIPSAVIHGATRRLSQFSKFILRRFRQPSK